MKFLLTFNQDQILPAKNAAIEKIAANLTLKGFRKGKAPKNLVEQSVDQEKLLEKTVSELIPAAYAEYVKAHDLKPITQPRISVSKMVPDGEWEFSIEIAEKPVVKLNKYQDAIKGELAKEAIWTPGKDEKKPETAESDKLNKILDTLIKTSEVEISELLIEEEANRSLSRLIEQVDKLGLTVDQYLQSLGKKPEELRKDYAENARNNLKLEFILEAIAHDQKIEATDADLEEAFKGADQKVIDEVRNHPMELATIKYSIVKRKVIDFLIKIA